MRPPKWLAIVPAALLCSPLFAQADAFRPPGQELQFRGGWFVPAGSSNFWDETEDVFTLDSGDLDDFVLGVSLVTRVSNHVEVGFNVDSYDGSASSEYRDYEDSAGFPIVHDTKLETIPMVVDLRFIIGDRYSTRRTRGRYVDQKPIAYLGGGIGVSYWSYRETGDFLDFQFDPPEIFYGSFKDDGFALTAEALAGVEVPLGGRWNALAEARYTWSEADLSGDFAGLGTLDLGGLAIYAGFGVRF